jgi:hypothetical protein
VQLAPPSGGTITIAKSDIEERLTSPISSMPPVGDLFTQQQLGDLVAFLTSLRKNSTTETTNQRNK